MRLMMVVGTVAPLLFACSTTATISRRSGPDVEAEIVGGSPESVWIDDDDGRRSVIARSDIREVDHPGNVHAVIGALLVGYGTFNVAVGISKCQERSEFRSGTEQGAFCTGLFAPAVLGAGMVLWGWAVNSDSKAALGDTSGREPTSPARPPQP